MRHLSCLNLSLGLSVRARWVGSKRSISASASKPSREESGSGYEVEQFNVKAGSAATITVDLYNSTALGNASNTLIIHLPPTGTHLQHTHPKIPSYLITPKTALASINYRWNIPAPSSSSSENRPLSSSPAYANHTFPTPLHDTLAGYTFLLSLLAQRSPQLTSPSFTPTTPAATRTSLYAPSPPSTLPIQRPLLLYGSFMGGTLATSLALTENISSRSLPTKIVGLITKNAVFDWADVVTSPTPIPPPSPPSKDPSEKLTRDDSTWDVQTLHTLKEHLFASPASAFDSFASPTLFFRTSGLAIPQSWVAEDDLPDTPTSAAASQYKPGDLSPSESEDLWPSEEGSIPPPSASSSPSPSPSPSSVSSLQNVGNDQSSLAKRMSQLYIEPPSRPAHLKYPPASSNLKIPFSLFLYTPSPPPTTSSSPPSSRSAPKTKPSPKTTKPAARKKQPALDAEGQASPGGHAKQMASLLRRSVLLHEFSERKMWDEDLDPEAASEARASVVALRSWHGRSSEEREAVEGHSGAEDEEGEAVSRWIEEISG